MDKFKFVIENKMHPSVKFDITLMNCILKATGLLPVNLKLHFSWLNHLYSLLVLCIVISFSVRGIVKIYSTMHLYISTVTLVAAHFQLLGLTLASWVVLVCSVIRFNVYEAAFEKLIKVEEVLFDKINVNAPKQSRLIKHFIYAIIFLLILMITDYFFLLHDGPKYFRSYLVTFHSSFIFIILSDGHAITIFELVKIRFKQVNDYFINALRPNRTLDTPSLFIIPQHSLTKTKIKELSHTHCDLIGITNEFNSYFSPMLLLEIAVFFTISTCNAYNFFYVLTNTKAEQFYKPTAIYSAYWTLGVFCKLIFLLKSSVSLTKEANITSSIVHGIMISGDFPTVHKELEIFAQHLIHEKLQIQTCGFFSLDYSLLHGMITAGTTYLIILIQFQISTDHS